jgi:hypothetical protein
MTEPTIDPAPDFFAHDSGIFSDGPCEVRVDGVPLPRCLGTAWRDRVNIAYAVAYGYDELAAIQRSFAIFGVHAFPGVYSMHFWTSPPDRDRAFPLADRPTPPMFLVEVGGRVTLHLPRDPAPAVD